LADIRPFRGIHYNQSLIKDISTVICPPYDIISPQLRQDLYQRSQHNFVRLEYSRELPQDTATDNKYTRSAVTLEQWLNANILMRDQAPAIYLHNHYFTYQGKEYKRRGMIARVRLEEWEKMVVRPHEGTLSEPKTDRLSLLWALQANTSPVLALFEDEGGVSPVLQAQEKTEPMIGLSGYDGERHYVWAINEPGEIDRICGSLANKPLYIADGHHRYESALTYQRERRNYSQSTTPEDAFNFVMMTLVDFSDPGLMILPPHRLVRGITKTTLNALASRLESFFEIDMVPASTPGVWQQVDDLLSHGQVSQDRLVIFGLMPEHLLVLRVRDLNAAKEMMPYFHGELYKRFIVSVVDHIILERILGLSITSEESVLAYSYDRQDAVNKVLDQEYQLALLLSPVKAEQIKAIADAGDRMPRKSTYFYPKAPAGLVLYRLV
jgi:uncharacterized protein (DUF1015 family)